jgi:hypothetical protein
MTTLVRFTCLVVFLLFAQAQALLFMLAGALEQRAVDGEDVLIDGGDLRTTAWSAIVLFLVLFVAWVLLKKAPEPAQV